MAFSIWKEGTKRESAQTDSDGGKSFVREIFYSCDPNDTDADLLESVFYPQIGAAHRDYPSYTCESISAPIYQDALAGSPAGKKIYVLEATYKKSVSSITLGIAKSRKKPWELGVQNVRFGTETVEIPWSNGYDDKGLPTEMKTTAGTPLMTTKTMYLKTIEYDKSYKYNGKKTHTTDDHSYNKNEVTICGVKILPECGKRFPVESQIFTEYKSNGDIDYQYETCHYKIVVHPSSWYSWILNVSTLALWPKERGGSATGNLYLGAIYKYTPWTSKNSETNASTEPQYGSIEHVKKAQADYWAVVGSKTEQIPWEEVTEPMPLKANGTLDMDAIKHPDIYPYYQ